jgi:hypothetical protein
MTPSTDDEARWAEAQSILDRAPTESAAERLRRARRNRWLLVAGLTLVSLGLGVLVALFLLDPSPDAGEGVPTWRLVVGFTISGLALLFMLVALVVQFRALRRTRAWGSPLHVLTRRQRKELLAAVRGRVPVVPERLPLARHLAELLLVQRLALLVQAGMMVNFVGLWIADPEPYRLVVAAVFCISLLVAGLLLQRENRRAKRFLDAHPASVPPTETLRSGDA